jgi:hypothetical protein
VSDYSAQTVKKHSSTQTVIADRLRSATVTEQVDIELENVSGHPFGCHGQLIFVLPHCLL